MKQNPSAVCRRLGDEVQYIGEGQCFSMCDVCLLCEDVYYFREYSYRENHFLKQKFLLMLFVFFLYLLLPPPSRPPSSPLLQNLV